MLYQDHAPYVRSLLTRLLGPWADADDALQDVFVLAWRKYDDVQPRNLRAWVTGIAIRRASELRRRSWLRHMLPFEIVPEVADSRSPETIAEANEADRMVYSALERLSERKRMVFILYEIQGMSGHEISEAVGCPLKTVWTRLHHARREFSALVRGALDKRGGQP